MVEPTIKARLVLDAGAATGAMAGAATAARGAVPAAGGKGIPIKGMSGLLKAVSGILAVVVSIAAIVTAAGGTLLKVLGTIVKLIGLLFKPILDILAIGLLPLIFLLKPFAKIVNLLFKPFLRAALIAFKAGRALGAAGDTEGAAEAFGLGILALLKPILNVILLQFQGLLQVILSVVQIALTPFVAILGQLIEFLTGGAIKAEEFFAAFLDGFNQAREAVGTFITGLIETTDEALFDKIRELAEAAGIDVGNALETVGITFGEISDQMTETINAASEQISIFIGEALGISGELVKQIISDLELLRREGVDPLTQSSNTLFDRLRQTVPLVDALASALGKVAGAASKVLRAAQALEEGAKIRFRGAARGAAIGGVAGLGGGPLGALGGGILGGIIGAISPRTVGVRDAIITKRGDVIMTDPEDTITASRRGAAGGGTFNISVNLNTLDPSAISSTVIDKIAREITEKIKRETFGRSSYATGV